MKPADRRRVFIIHGHDHSNVAKLKKILVELGLIPVVLMDEPNRGRTIIEKFEALAERCDLAIALMTPDDKMAEDVAGEEVFRARQNLFLEVGWFMAARSRRKVILLHKGKVEIPSDLLGILYMPFATSVEELRDDLATELRGIGAPLSPPKRSSSSKN